jgi:hypothetical protein
MSYIGRGLQAGAFRQLDDISSGFDGSDTTHTMQVNSANVTVGDVNQILLSLGGVIQKPGTDFTVSGSVLTFTTAPAANTSFFAILLGSDNGGTVTPTDASVTSAKLSGNLVTPGTLDVNGQELILDADADTSITADTDDQIDFKVGGNDTHVFDANGHVVLKQFLDATTAGGRITGASNRGNVARINLYQTAGSSDGGHIRFETANSSNSMTEGMRLSSAGEVTKPLQPAFHVEPASQQSNMATGAQVVWGTENFDIGSNFASNTFTAPVTGKYFIGHSIRLMALDSAASYYLIQITASNRNHYHIFDPDGLSQDSTYQEFTNAVLLDMDANDTVDIAFAYSGGAQQVDLSTASYFYGYLLG